MGCWNQTCFLSRLPIHAGDPVTVILLASNAATEDLGGGPCESTELFSPLLVPIHGNYDDYGGVEDTPPQPADKMMDWFRESMEGRAKGVHPMKLSPERCAKGEAKINPPLPTDLHELVRETQEGRITYHRYGRSWGKLGYVMMHQSVYQHILATIGKRVPYSNTSTYQELLRASSAAMVKLLRVPLGELKENATEEETAEYMVRKYSTRTEELRFLEGNLNRNLFEYLLREMDPTTMAVTVADFRLTLTAIDYMRILWIPQVGQGSQASEYELHKALIAAMGEVVSSYCLNHDIPEKDFTGRETVFWRE